jgi:tRNASer (uridine44-2'-O)-methyltransferase
MFSRSSPSTCFFLLPCCPHDFNCKFSTVEKGKSKYGTYIDYVKDITVNCGFTPEVDTLRIPSTKRVRN